MLNTIKLKHLFALVFLICSPFLQAVYSQDFSSLDSELQTLENLINDTIVNTQEQQKLLEDLKTSLNKSESTIASYENIIQEQEKLLENLQLHLNEMSEIYKKQSALSVSYERKLKFWRIFTIVAIPATALISGGIVWAAVR